MSLVWSMWNGNLVTFPLLITAISKLGETGPLRPLSRNKCKQNDFNWGSGIRDLCAVLLSCLGSFWAVTVLRPHNEQREVCSEYYYYYPSTWRRQQITLKLWTLKCLQSSLSRCNTKTPLSLSHVKLDGLCFSLDGSCCSWILKCGWTFFFVVVQMLFYIKEGTQEVRSLFWVFM